MELQDKIRKFYESRNMIHWKLLSGIFRQRTLDEIKEIYNLSDDELGQVDFDNFLIDLFDTNDLYELTRHLQKFDDLDKFLKEDSGKYYQDNFMQN